MVEAYPVALVVVGIAILGAVFLPRVLSDEPLSLPIIYVISGFLLFTFSPGVSPPDMVEQSVAVEHLTELVVIIALMGAGLKIDRPFSWRDWSWTWRLLGITMPLTIVAAAFLGWYVLGLHVATAVLLGAVVAPTDPVLASDVDAGPPLLESEEAREEYEHEERIVRFTLSSEAGLNDGLAFPFTYLAISLAAAGSIASFGWAGDWLLVDVVYKIGVGVGMGYVLGKLLARIVFRLPAESLLAQTMAGAEALAGTLIIYGLTEVVQGYGFIAVFVGALVLRQFEFEHEYHQSLYDFAVMVERLLMAAVLVLFGGALAGGLLAPLRPIDVAVALTLVVVVRPLAGILGLLGTGIDWPGRAVISAYGIRGIGSFYYLAYALNEATFAELELLVAADRLWAFVGFLVLTSIFLHGLTANRVMTALDAWQQAKREQPDPSFVAIIAKQLLR
ncbi:cation:proton antiporter [Natronomonas salina]|uniref:cation:proton antiporter n=1 Tax=Natronomonas salina TaxID=1710540 RepID=UPI0015B61548|nr:cation:proton antiporter [Natronomonas salina]QLD89029.1 cation:proton antiporter [Natronomonas salina]